MNCMSCRFFMQHKGHLGFNREKMYGECRRNAPKANTPYAKRWPSVEGNEWCGRYEEKR